MLKKEQTSPKKGMQRDKAIFDLEKIEYRFMLNGNFHDEHGNGQINLQNEPSNIYCTGFREGYKVIGHKFDVVRDVTYFFLVNPDTGASEIGCMDSFQNITGLEPLEAECNCNITVMIEQALENAVQEATCTYKTLITDECLIEGGGDGCLNFSIDSPIHESNIIIKHDRTGSKLYFTDYDNPQRFIELDNLIQYTQDIDPCTSETIDTCLECAKMRIFPLFEKPCLHPKTIESGGNLRAGMYEVLVAYSSARGEEISNYYAKTNQIPIHDRDNNILDQTNLDYLTNQAISVDVSDLDGVYDYFKIVVVYRSGLDAATRYHEYGVFPIDTDSIIISTLVDKPTIPLQNVLAYRPHYTKAKGLATGSGFLYQHGLESNREINLQQVVNLMGGFVNWQTVEAKESLHQDGIGAANYRGYMRDEVVPASIKFFGLGGEETLIFPFIPRPATSYELEELGEAFTDTPLNVDSILNGSGACSATNRNKRWQYENTATVIGACPGAPVAGDGGPVLEQELECLIQEPNGDISVLATVASGAVSQDLGGTALETYINANAEIIMVTTDPDWAAVKTVLNNPASYVGDCVPEFPDNCDNIALVSEEMVAIGAETTVVTEVPEAYADQIRAVGPVYCSQIFPPSAPDTVFQSAYMRAGDVVYGKTQPFSNTSCTVAITPPEFQVSIQHPGHLIDAGALSSETSLQTSFDSSAVAQGYTNKVHSNALWYKVTFTGQFSAFEISPVIAGLIDDNSGNSLRITVFDGCGAAADLPAYSRIVGDVSTVNDPDKYVELDSADFAGDAYIAVDSAINEDVELEIELINESTVLTIVGTVGSTNITIDGTPYTITFNTDLTTTASDWITAESATVLTSHNINVTSVVDKIIFTMVSGTSLPVITFTDIGTLTGTFQLGETELTIDAVVYTLVFNTDFTTTASDFVTLTAPTILAAHDVILTSTGGVLNIRAERTISDTIVIDPSIGTLDGVVSTAEQYFTLTPPAGCFNTYSRALELTSVTTYTNLTFGKRQLYQADCTLEISTETECGAVPHKFGLFSHWQSEQTYPCNEELFDSSALSIDPSDIPESIKPLFEAYYTDGFDAVNAQYNMKPNTDFRDQPIKHYKFPCNITSPFLNGQEGTSGVKSSYIYPIGFTIEPEVVRAFLDIAVSNGLITLQERTNITSYEIYRGDRVTNKSIIAKGLLFDMYNYQDDGQDILYPNYPLNGLGLDAHNLTGHRRVSSASNDKYTFHSPDTHFHKPTLPPEMKIEAYQYGVSQTYFDIVNDHPTYIILGQKAKSTALILAGIEALFGLTVDVAEIVTLGGTGGVSAPISIAAAVIGVLALTAQMLLNIGRYRYEWLETIRNLGSPEQFAYYSATIGHYNSLVPNTLKDQTLRGVSSSTYLKEGRWTVPNELTGQNYHINNEDRESSVFIDTFPYDVTYPTNYRNYDNFDVSPNGSSRKMWDGVGASPALSGRAASPYASLKQYLPSQYGSIHSVRWLSTGYCGDINGLSAGCEQIFGGDTYISRFSVKRKLPFFTTNAVGLAPLTPFKYSDYFNINPDFTQFRHYLNYQLEDGATFNIAGTVFPDKLSSYQLFAGVNSDNAPKVFYVKPPAKFFLFSYGFPHFLTESTINSDYRYAGREAQENFYPNVTDVIGFTQEEDISIREPERFYYNDVYSTSPTTGSRNTMLPVDYSREIYDKLNNLDNQVIYSVQDRSEDIQDSWLIYKGLDTYNFPTSNGNLIDMDAIESEQILGRFENGMTLFNSIDVLRDRLAADQSNLGVGGIFSGRNINFNKTDLGYAGTQHVAKISCEFGHFWVDAKRGEVFNLAPNGEGLTQITDGVEKWFREHLPFKIASSVKGLDQRALDNNFKGLGLAMGWDAKTKRVFLTKLDYKPLIEGIEYINNKFFNGETEVFLTDPSVFEECSFTIAYSPLTKMWISYYSFKPNYYIGYTNYFQTGINYSVKDSHLGLWSHLPFLSSYQVFYGDLHPFTIEAPLSPSKLTNSTLHDIEYWLEVRKYYNKYDYADIVGHGFNKAVVYNSYQNTGQLELVHHKNNDLSQSVNFPKHNLQSIEILQSELAGKYSFNYLYNAVKDERSGLPLWLNDCAQVEQELNHKLLNYLPMYKDRLRGDYMMYKLAQDKESRYKMIYRFSTDTRDYVDN